MFCFTQRQKISQSQNPIHGLIPHNEQYTYTTIISKFFEFRNINVVKSLRQKAIPNKNRSIIDVIIAYLNKSTLTSVGEFNAIPSFSSVNIDFAQICFKIYANDRSASKGKSTKKCGVLQIKHCDV